MPTIKTTTATTRRMWIKLPATPNPSPKAHKISNTSKTVHNINHLTNGNRREALTSTTFNKVFDNAAAKGLDPNTTTRPGLLRLDFELKRANDPLFNCVNLALCVFAGRKNLGETARPES